MKARNYFIILIVLVFVAAFSGCGKGSGKTTLYVLNWGEYLDPDLIGEFEDANPDIKINYTTTTSNEEMYTVAATEGTKIDLIFPSDYMVERMMKEDLLAELDLANIPNFTYVEEVSKTRTFDPTSSYSVPYMMGTVGIVYNTTLVDEEVTSWGILWEEKYEKKIIMYDSIRDSIMVALAYLGYDINTTNEAELAEAEQLLIDQKDLVLSYGTDNIKDDMVGGSIALAVDYSGAAVLAISENSDLAYVVPEEGSNVWVDNAVILKTSAHKEAAERFINFLCDPEVAAKNAEYIGYTTPNGAAEEFMDEELLSNPAYRISSDVLSRCDYYVDLGESLSLFNNVWMRVKTAS